jgi:hypothetical protein
LAAFHLELLKPLFSFTFIILVLIILKSRRHSFIAHTIRHNELAVNILEGAISGEKAVGIP